MKPRKPEYEGPVMLPNGIVAADTGDRWHSYMPREFWTVEARNLFKASVDAGLLWLDDNDRWQRCEGITKGQLAYWCKKASTWLGLDRGATTSWVPFEKVFNPADGVDLLTGKREKPGNPLIKNLHDIDYTRQDHLGDLKKFGEDANDKRKAYLQPIDDFFAALEASDNEQK